MKSIKLCLVFISTACLGLLLIGNTALAQSAPAVSYSSFKSAYSSGNDALKKGHFVEAAKAYEAAEEMASSAKGRCDAYNAAGWALMKAKKWPDAKTVLMEAVTEDKDSKIAEKNLGFVCFNLYEYGFAGTEELKSAIQYLEASGENEELLDRAKSDLSREEAYAQATPEPEPSFKDKSFKTLLAMGDEAQANGKYAVAIKVFKHASLAANTSTTKGLAANRLGKVLLDDRKPREAVASFEEAVKEKPKEKVYLSNLAYSYWSVYDSGKGTIDDLKKAADAYYRVNSQDSTFHNEMLKMVLEELKEVDPATAGQYNVTEDSTDANKSTDVKGPGDDGDK